MFWELAFPPEMVDDEPEERGYEVIIPKQARYLTSPNLFLNNA